MWKSQVAQVQEDARARFPRPTRRRRPVELEEEESLDVGPQEESRQNQPPGEQLPQGKGKGEVIVTLPSLNAASPGLPSQTSSYNIYYNPIHSQT